MLSLRALLSLAAILSPALAQSIVRINALGDSITGNPGCWRAILWQRLQAAGVTNTDFVGTLNPDGCGFTYDGQHDGHGGFLATGIVRDNQLPGWLAVSQPDIVQVELGTNDVWSNIAPATIVAALSTLVDQMRAQNPRMRILVAQITPMLPTGCSDCPARVVAYNNAIAAWAPGKSTSTSPVSVVDCWTGFDTATDTGDGVHPNSNGNTKLANCWYEPLKAAILLAGGGTTPPVSTTTLITTTRSVPPTTTTTRTPVVTTTTRPPVTTSSTVRTSSTTTRVVTTTTAGGSGGGAPRWGQCGMFDCFLLLRICLCYFYALCFALKARDPHILLKTIW